MKVQYIEDKRRIIDMSASDEKIIKNINSLLPYLETTVESLKHNVDSLDIPILIKKVNEEIYKYYRDGNTDAAYFETNFALYLQELLYYKKNQYSGEVLFDLKTVARLEEEYNNLLRKQDSLILHRATENSRAMSLIQTNIQDAYLALCYESTSTVFTKDVTFDMLEIAFSKQNEIIREIFEIDTMTLLMGFYDIVLKHKRSIDNFTETGNESILNSLFPFIIESDILPINLIDDLTCDSFSIEDDIKYPYQNLLIQKKPFIRFNDLIYCFNPIALGNSLYYAIKSLIKEYDEGLYEKFLSNECDTLVDNYNLIHLLGPCNGINPIDQSDEYIPYVEDILQIRPIVRTSLSKVKVEDINDYDYDIYNHSQINVLYKIQPLDIDEQPIEVVQSKEATANQLWAQSLTKGLEPAPVVQPRPLDLNNTFTIDDDLKELLEDENEDKVIVAETTTGELNKLEDYLKSENLDPTQYEEIDRLEEREDLEDAENELKIVKKETENTTKDIIDSDIEELLEEYEEDIDDINDDDLDDIFEKSFHLVSYEEDEELQEDTLEDELLDSEDDYEDPNQLILGLDDGEDTLEDELLDSEDDYEDDLEEFESNNDEEIIEEAVKEKLSSTDEKKDIDIFAEAEFEDLIDMNLPKYVQLLADICEKDDNRHMYNWILNMGTSSNASFNGLLENIYNKICYDNSDKLVNLPNDNTTVLFYTDEDNKERDKQRLHNVAATMKLKGEFTWTAYHIIYNNMGEIIRTKTSKISNSEFSESDWQIIENMALALASRKR